MYRNKLEAEKYATNSTNINDGAEQGSAVCEFGEGVATHNQSRIRPRRYLLLIHLTHLQSPPPERLYAMCIPFGWTIYRTVTCNTAIHHIHQR